MKTRIHSVHKKMGKKIGNEKIGVYRIIAVVKSFC